MAIDKLKEAIDQAWVEEQAKIAERDRLARAEEEEREKELFSKFKLPFDQATIDLLPPVQLELHGDQVTAWFEYDGVVFNFAEVKTRLLFAPFVEDYWIVTAYLLNDWNSEDDVLELLSLKLGGSGCKSAEDFRREFLLFMRKAIDEAKSDQSS